MSQLLFLVLLLCGSLASAWCPASVCPYTYGTIYAGQTLVAGDLALYSTPSGIGIQITSVNGWTYSEVDIYVGTTPPPSTPSGPAPGSFPYKAQNLGSVTTYTLELTFAELGLQCGVNNLYVAVHTVTSNPSLGHGCSATETGWGYVSSHSHCFPAKWGWYLDWATCCCAPHTTVAPPTTKAQTSAHQTTQAQTSAHQTTQAQTSAHQTTQAQTSAHQTTQAQTSAHQTTVAPTTAPQTTAVPPVQTTAPPSVGSCSDIYHFFGQVPSEYNVFSFGDFVCYNSDTQGRVAAQGNIDIRYYSVGCQLFNFNPSSNCVAYGYTCEQIAESGDLVDTVVAGGNVTAYNAEVQSGNIAFGGTYNNDITVQFGAGCTLFNGQLIDFNEWYAYLTQLSSVISHLNPTASVVNTYGSLSITASGSSTLEVFNIPASELCSSYGLTVTGASPTASIFFNVAGTAVSCTNGYQMNGFSANQTVWNFYEASTLTVQNFAWIGSILAPYAVMQDSQGGNFNGQVFVASWESSTGACAQQNWIPFVGCIPGQ